MMDAEIMLSDLAALVSCESPSSDLTAVARSAGVVSDIGQRLTKAEPERIVRDGRTHLRWRFGGGGAVLLLAHHDTVWPVGSLAKHPWRIADGIAHGPGCFDTKAGIVQMFHALSALRSREGVTVLVNGDEELGSPSSRALIQDEARRATSALIVEPSAAGGALKTARKGVSRYHVRIHGRAAHAGLEPWDGINAAVESAHQVLALAALDDGPDGATVTPTMVTAGSTVNTVPATAEIEVDVRVPSETVRDRLDATLRGLTPRVTGAHLEVDADPSHPPMELSSSSGLLALAKQVADKLGLESLNGAYVGGASDGNLTAGVGTPTLDGLGAVGGGAHALGEHVVVAEMPRRAALLGGLVEALLADVSGTTTRPVSDGAARP